MSGTLTWRRRRGDTTASPVTLMNSSATSTLNSSYTGSFHNRDESFTDGDDEILESLVKTATKAATPRPTQRERKRTRQADRKSCKYASAAIPQMLTCTESSAQLPLLLLDPR